MFGFIKKMFFVVAGFVILNTIPLKYVSMNNQECKVRPATINVNSNESLFYPYSIAVNTWSGFCYNISDPSSKLCVPVVKNINIKVFSLMSRTNKARHISWHETCTYKCRLDASVYSNKKRWNNDKYSCEWKNWLAKKDMMMNLIGILVHRNVNVMNRVMFGNI